MMLAGFEAPTSGSIRTRGRPVNDLPPPRKRAIGSVFQNYALFPHMTVGGNLAFPLEVSRLDSEQRRERVQRAQSLNRAGQSPELRGGVTGGPPGRDPRAAATRIKKLRSAPPRLLPAVFQQVGGNPGRSLVGVHCTSEIGVMDLLKPR